MLADAEARLTLLREHAGVLNTRKTKRREEQERERELLKEATNPGAQREAMTGSSSLTATGGGGHIKLFEDLEQGIQSVETEKGIPLAPSAKKELSSL